MSPLLKIILERAFFRVAHCHLTNRIDLSLNDAQQKA